jgi:hypothetical protein
MGGSGRKPAQAFKNRAFCSCTGDQAWEIACESSRNPNGFSRCARVLPERRLSLAPKPVINTAFIPGRSIRARSISSVPVMPGAFAPGRFGRVHIGDLQSIPLKGRLPRAAALVAALGYIKKANGNARFFQEIDGDPKALAPLGVREVRGQAY